MGGCTVFPPFPKNLVGLEDLGTHSETWSRELDSNSIRALGEEETRKELDEAG